MVSFSLNNPISNYSKDFGNHHPIETIILKWMFRVPGGYGDPSAKNPDTLSKEDVFLSM